MAFVNDVINSRPRGSSQKLGVGVCETSVTVGVCINASVGVDVAGMIKFDWGVRCIRAVGGGASSTGIEQLARVKIIKVTKCNLVSTRHPF